MYLTYRTSAVRRKLRVIRNTNHRLLLQTNPQLHAALATEMNTPAIYTECSPMPVTVQTYDALCDCTAICVLAWNKSR
jgi:hypothetical protein